ncbi:MAG: tRNA uridine-5-carboxymethylaminomethyl(34) synthesis GTPase MnmE [Shimia sp.]
MDTIFAPATPVGRSGVGIIRISGPNALDCAVRLGAGTLPARQAVVRRLRSEGGEVLDDAVVVYFPGPGSFTGEDVVELQHHGSRAVCRALLDTIGAQPGLRMARAGEFTERAFLAGRLSLSQVESLADLLDAETEAQRRLAQRGLDSGMNAALKGVRQDCIDALMYLEGSIDFSDEGDIPASLYMQARSSMEAAQAKISQHLRALDRAQRVREGFTVALIGPPNAGKSTLVNAIAGRDVALTSPTPGTTRDAIEVRLSLGGYLVTLVDLAGIRDDAEGVEAAGIARAERVARSADLRIHVSKHERAKLADFFVMGDVVVATHRDEVPDADVDGRSGDGTEELLETLARHIRELAEGAGVASHDRHRECLLRAGTSLSSGSLALDVSVELAADDVYQALDALSALVGDVSSDDVLSEIFARFCIGK